MKIFKIKAHKDKCGRRQLCIDGFVTSEELNRIKRKLKAHQISIDELPTKDWVEFALFDYDF